MPRRHRAVGELLNPAMGRTLRAALTLPMCKMRLASPPNQSRPASQRPDRRMDTVLRIVFEGHERGTRKPRRSRRCRWMAVGEALVRVGAAPGCLAHQHDHAVQELCQSFVRASCGCRGSAPDLVDGRASSTNGGAYAVADRPTAHTRTPWSPSAVAPPEICVRTRGPSAKPGSPFAPNLNTPLRA